MPQKYVLKKANIIVQRSFVTNETGGRNDDSFGPHYHTRQR